jgi:lysozyme
VSLPAPPTQQQPAPTGGQQPAPTGGQQPAPTGGQQPAPTGGQQPAPTKHVGGGTVTVKPGDSLYEIAGKRLGNPNLYPLIEAANPGAIGPNGLIHPGQVLHIPQVPASSATSTSTTHVVQSGEDLWEIAGGDPALVQRIAQLNHISDPRLIYPGQSLIIPASA